MQNPNKNSKDNWTNHTKIKPCDYWNTLIWSTILDNRNISGTTIDKYELIDMFSNYLKRDEVIELFSIINTKRRSISQREFTDFIQHIDDPSYITLVNLFKPSEYKHLILNAIESPTDNRDWVYGKYANIDRTELPPTLD